MYNYTCKSVIEDTWNVVGHQLLMQSVEATSGYLVMNDRAKYDAESVNVCYTHSVLLQPNSFLLPLRSLPLCLLVCFPPSTHVHSFVYRRA